MTQANDIKDLCRIVRAILVVRLGVSRPPSSMSRDQLIVALLIELSYGRERLEGLLTTYGPDLLRVFRVARMAELERQTSTTSIYC